eukprot:scaffold54349_cov68-Phaeocystis_antarctica.AAC.2
MHRRLLGRGEAAEVDALAVAPLGCNVRPHLAGVRLLHIAKPALDIGAGQRKPLRFSQRDRLHRRHRRRQGRAVCRLGRPGDVQRCLLGRREDTEEDQLALALHLHLVRSCPARRLHEHAAKTALVSGAADERQPLRLRLRPRLLRCHRRG